MADEKKTNPPAKTEAVVGNPSVWKLICRSKKGDETFSTRGIHVVGLGVILQTDLRKGNSLNISSANLIPGAALSVDAKGVTNIVKG